MRGAVWVREVVAVTEAVAVTGAVTVGERRPLHRMAAPLWQGCGEACRVAAAASPLQTWNPNPFGGTRLPVEVFGETFQSVPIETAPGRHEERVVGFPSEVFLD